MTREDLFIAIGDIDDTCLSRCEKYPVPSSALYLEDTDMEFEKKIRHGRIRNIMLIAAIIALMLFLMGSAIAALVRMRVEPTNMYVQSGTKPKENMVSTDSQANSQNDTKSETDSFDKIYEGEIVHFDKTHDQFIELGNYYPQQLPAGYTMTFVSGDAPLQNQVVHYENGNGGLIKYWVYLGNPASSVEIYCIEDKTEVQVNGHDGLLYRQTGGSCTLIWINSEKGFGMVLQANDPAVDLLAMAESTAEGEVLVPTRLPQTLQALEELGDFSPEYLPENFVELNVQGSPLSQGSGWYSYVRKLYVNKAENTVIYFEYESYRIVTEDGYTDDAKTACSFYIPGYHILKDEAVGTETEINGLFGIVTDQDIAWADPETHRVFHLHSEDVTGEALLKVAQSIRSIS